MEMLALLTVEPKDGGCTPSADEVAQRLNDVLADVTKHDDVIGWRVTRVEAGAVLS